MSHEAKPIFPQEILFLIFKICPSMYSSILQVNKSMHDDIKKYIENNPTEVMIAAVSEPEVTLRILPLLKKHIMKPNIKEEWRFIYSALTAEKIVKDNGESQFEKKSLLHAIDTVAPDNEETRKNTALMNLRYSILAIVNPFSLKEAERREIFYNLGGVNFSNNGNITDLCLKGANLHMAKFDWIRLTNIDFSYANLKEAIFKRVRLVSINFAQANLQSICFNCNVIQEANFEYADIKEGKFYGNSYQKINFTGAVLIKAIFGVTVHASEPATEEPWTPTQENLVMLNKKEILKWFAVNFQSVSNGVFKIDGEYIEEPDYDNLRDWTDNIDTLLRKAPSVELLNVTIDFLDFSHEQIMSAIRLVLIAYAGSQIEGTRTELLSHKKNAIVKLIESIDENPEEDYLILLNKWQANECIKIIKSHRHFFPLAFFGHFAKAAKNSIINNEPMPSVEELSQTDAESLIKKTGDIYKTWKTHQDEKKASKEKNPPEKAEEDRVQFSSAPTTAASLGGGF